MGSKKRYRIVTHSGDFHPDDVFAVAVLLRLWSDALVVRSRDPAVIADGNFVVDVGGEYDESRNRFDHHQEGGAGVRQNSVPYASFGLVWRKFGPQVCSDEKIAARIDKRLVQCIDALDNGVGEIKPIFDDVYPFTLGLAILTLNPTWREHKGSEERLFKDAVKMANNVIYRLISIEKDEYEGEQIVEAVYQSTPDKRIIVLEDNYPWEEVLRLYSEPFFVVEPSHDRGGEGWKVKSVRDNLYSFVNRKDLPASWAGKREADLASITGVSDAIFCHTKRFIAVARTRQGAIELAKIALTSS